MILVGDQEFGSPKTPAAFAPGLPQFTVLLTLNFIALRIARRQVNRVGQPDPGSALNPIATSHIDDRMWELKNYSIIIVIHSMQQAARVSQRTGFFTWVSWRKWVRRREYSRILQRSRQGLHHPTWVEEEKHDCSFPA